MGQKTNEALDNLVAEALQIPSSILNSINRLIAKGGSSRLLTVVGTIAGEYVIATQAGLEPLAALGAGLGLAFTGTSYVVYKSKQHVQEAKSNNKPKPTPKPSPVVEVSPPKPVILPQYDEPLTNEQLRGICGSQDNAYLRMECFEGMLNHSLMFYHPALRIEVADSIVMEFYHTIEAAWKESLSGAKAKEIVPLPLPQDFDSYDATEEYKKKVMDAIPGCQWLTEPQHMILNMLKDCYVAMDWINKLRGKEIDWDVNIVFSINSLVAHGYKALKT